MNAISPSVINPSTISFTIKLESEDYAPEDSEWQEECHKFYLQLKNTLDMAIVEPLKLEKKEKGYRCDQETIFFLLHLIVAVVDVWLVLHAIEDFSARQEGAKITLDFGGKNYMEYVPLLRPLLSKELECDKCPDKDKCILDCPQLGGKKFFCKLSTRETDQEVS